MKLKKQQFTYLKMFLREAVRLKKWALLILNYLKIITSLIFSKQSINQIWIKMIKPETYVKIFRICLQQLMPTIHKVLTEIGSVGKFVLSHNIN